MKAYDTSYLFNAKRILPIQDVYTGLALNSPWIALNLIVVLKSIEKAVNFEEDLKNYQLFMKKITYNGKLVPQAFIEN